MTDNQVVPPESWVKARKQLLAKEKEFTRLRDELSQARRDLPWVRVTKNYRFDGPEGEQTLCELFDGRSQLIVYHFMFGPDWDSGCKSCSFWADNFNGIVPHLNQRDVTFAAISRAPLAKLRAFAACLGWSFRWLSSFDSDFNFDFNVSFTPEAIASGSAIYNYAASKMNMEELPGISVFFKSADGEVFHTYSCYARGLDMLNTAYHYLDLVPKGRDEAGLSFPMAWVRLRNHYDNRLEKREDQR
jgi:predicted dithiol-disulfide oxidoreductase (DUF899 family)